MTFLIRLLKIAALLLLGSLVGTHLLFFAIRTMHLLAYPFPLDYGEGPLLTQVRLIRDGLPLWQLYGDPAHTPYTVVNYPPIYHLVTWFIGIGIVPFIEQEPHAILLAGRVVSLLSGVGCVVALFILSRANPEPHNQKSRSAHAYASLDHPTSAVSRTSPGTIALVGLALLGIPIMREWSSVMRVDLLGVCLGLFGLVIVTRQRGSWQILWAAPVFTLALLTKPSLVAAPAGALIWLLFRDWRRALGLGGLIGVIGGLAVGLLQWGSGGWFWVHVVSANANPWDADLAHGFWRDQIVLMQPLILAAVVTIGAGLLFKSQAIWLPLYYTLFGLMTAFGVGKLGAYSNYFLEAYAGLFWLAAAGITEHDALHRTRDGRMAPTIFWQLRGIVAALRPIVLLILVALSLTRYYPLWSEEYLLPAGIIEGRNPVRISFGSHGIWQDLQREQLILQTRARINQALADPIQAANGPIFTDIPGVAAQMGVGSREQVFEHRMLFDIGLWDQRPLLRDLASGHVPLIVLDYLGNWLTPAQITLITHRYAQDLSIGTYSIYRPIDPGPRRDLDLAFADGLRVTAVHLSSAADGGDSYSPGETVIVTLEWRQINTALRVAPAVVLQVADRAGRPLFETSRPLLYAALVPADWGTDELQHVQPVSLPPELPPGMYQLRMVVRSDGNDRAAPQVIATLTVAEHGGRILGEQGFYVPEPLLAEWERLGGYVGPGDPVMPAVPFAGFVQQCFKTTCLRLINGRIERLPAGELAWMADAALPRITGAPAEGQLSPEFQQFYDQQGGVAALGPVLGVEMKRFGDIVQYTRYARLERPLTGGPARLGNVGEDVLRLPGGTPYRWP